MSEHPADLNSLLLRYFPETTSKQLNKFSQLVEQVREWNTRVNLISRKDIENLNERHLLHSLAAARVWHPQPGNQVADLGTGGGFPGLPLAIFYPRCRFTLVDSVAKKARAVEEIAKTLKLKNVRVLNERAEILKSKYDYIFGRAVAPLPQFLEWSLPLVRRGKGGRPGHGVFYFKGTHYLKELEGHPRQPSHVWKLDDFFDEPYFSEKFLLHFKR
ncbi:MAG: 16S rRNA (guanine(527)-N(7))-methyltransferase RsmG [Planctomycetaceae bacterium]